MNKKEMKDRTKTSLFLLIVQKRFIKRCYSFVGLL